MCRKSTIQDVRRQYVPWPSTYIVAGGSICSATIYAATNAPVTPVMRNGLGGFYQCNNHTQFKSDKKCREKQFAVLHFCTPVTFKYGRHTGMNGQNSAEIVIVHSLKDRHPRKGQPSCFCWFTKYVNDTPRHHATAKLIHSVSLTVLQSLNLIQWNFSTHTHTHTKKKKSRTAILRVKRAFCESRFNL